MPGTQPSDWEAHLFSGSQAVTVEVDTGVDDGEVEVEEVGIEAKVNVGWAEAMLQNCCARLSIAGTSVGQLANTQSTISAG